MNQPSDVWLYRVTVWFVHSKLLYKLGMIMKIILNLDPPNWTFKFIHLKNALNERKWSMFVKMNTEH